jgi:hypothetical protein
LKCPECGCDVDVQLPESDVGLGGGAACLNEDCPKFEVDVWQDYQESLVDEDGHAPRKGVR